MKRQPFTLLEVVVAMLILSVGVSAMLWQFGSASRRLEQSWQDWLQTHELSQAAEYVLLAGPEQKPDEQFQNPDYQVEIEYTDPDLPDDFKQQTANVRLAKLIIRLLDSQRDEIDRLEMDCWKDTSAHEL